MAKRNWSRKQTVPVVSELKDITTLLKRDRMSDGQTAETIWFASTLVPFLCIDWKTINYSMDTETHFSLLMWHQMTTNGPKFCCEIECSQHPFRSGKRKRRTDYCCGEDVFTEELQFSVHWVSHMKKNYKGQSHCPMNDWKILVEQWFKHKIRQCMEGPFKAEQIAVNVKMMRSLKRR